MQINLFVKFLIVKYSHQNSSSKQLLQISVVKFTTLLLLNRIMHTLCSSFLCQKVQEQIR